MPKVFESKLGDVKVFLDRIIREKRVGDWEKIESEFQEHLLVDSVNFSNIETVDLDLGSYYSVLKITVDGEKLNMFFRDSDEVEECFKALKYGLNVYRENH